MQNQQPVFGKRGSRRPNVQAQHKEESDFEEGIWNVLGTIHVLISFLFNKYVAIAVLMVGTFMAYIVAEVDHDRYLDSINYVALVQNSDDYHKHSEIFISVTRELIDKGKCAPADFAGTNSALPWLMSTGDWNKRGSVYFVHCGGSSTFDLIYLNINNGRPFRWIVPLNPNSTTLPFPDYFLK